MAMQIDNGFTTYEFTEEELVSAATFTTMQRMYLQTLRAGAAQELAALDYDPLNPIQFAQMHASLKGQLQAYDHLLDHDIAEEAAERWAEINKNRNNSSKGQQ